jgi:hypothetical protein
MNNGQRPSASANVLRSTFAGHSITTTSEQAPPLEWIEEYHSPFFEHHWQEKRLTPHLEIVSVNSEDLALNRLSGKDATIVKGFLGRSLYKWHDSNGSHWLHPGRCWIRRSEDFLIGINPGAEEAVFEPARLLREIAVQKMLATGAVKLKGNVVVTRDGRGILILGDKGSGKTIVTLNELSSGGAFIGNSRVLVKCNSRTVEGIGLPITIRIGEDTIKAIDGLARWYSGYPESSQLKIASYDEQVRIRKIELTPRELAGALGVMIVPSVVLDQVWYLTREVEDSPDLFRKAIKKSLINKDPAFPAFWLEAEHAISADTVETEEKLLGLPWARMNPDEVLQSFRNRFHLC